MSYISLIDLLTFDNQYLYAKSKEIVFIVTHFMAIMRRLCWYMYKVLHFLTFVCFFLFKIQFLGMGECDVESLSATS